MLHPTMDDTASTPVEPRKIAPSTPSSVRAITRCALGKTRSAIQNKNTICPAHNAAIPALIEIVRDPNTPE